jgi:hypothetical protein
MFGLRVLIVVLSLLLVPSSAAAAASPSLVNVRLSDLPQGTQLAQDWSRTAKHYAAKVGLPANSYTKLGLVTISDRVFWLNEGKNPNAQLNPEVDVYSSTTQAHAAFLRVERVQRDAMAHPTVPTALRTLTFGDERRSVSDYDETNNGNPARATITFRRGRYTLSVFAQGTTRAFTVAEVGQYARLIDSRILQAR